MRTHTNMDRFNPFLHTEVDQFKPSRSHKPLLFTLTNSANICVYLKLGLTETTNISFFVLSTCDFIMSASTVVLLIFYSRLVSGIRLPSGAMAAEIGVATGYVYMPCVGCSAWITAIISTERCLCIAMPLKVNIRI